MAKNNGNVSQFNDEDIVMSIKTEPETVYEREGNANSTSENRNSCVTSDGDRFLKIPSKKKDESMEDSYKLRELLKEFCLEGAWPYLRVAQITYRSLLYIRKEDLKEALPPLGLRVEFREKLFAWRKRKYGIDEELLATKVEEWLGKMPSFSSWQLQEQSPNNNRCILNKDLKSILMETTKGKKILKFYEENHLLNDSNRNDFLNVIIEEIIFSKMTLQQRDFVNLLEEIFTLFPTERDCQECYYIPRHGKKNPSGRLYTKYVNCRTKNRKLETSQQMESFQQLDSLSNTPTIYFNTNDKDAMYDLSNDACKR